MTDPIVVQDLVFEVEVWDDEPTTLFARWYEHPQAIDEIAGPAAVLVCLPGGTYDHAYFDLDIPGEEYSFARWMAERGYVVVAFDSLGTGHSTRPTAHEVGFPEMACATAAAVEAIRDRVPTTRRSSRSATRWAATTRWCSRRRCRATTRSRCSAPPSVWSASSRCPRR